jgi:hypothetical protein
MLAAQVLPAQQCLWHDRFPASGSRRVVRNFTYLPDIACDAIDGDGITPFFERLVTTLLL